MANQPEPAPIKTEPAHRYSRIGLVIGICGLMINTLVISGNLAYLFFGSFVGFIGVVISLMGLTEPVQQHSPRSKKMAMTGLVTSVAGIVPFVVLICYSVSEGHKSRESSACLSRLKGVGLALRMYADDNDGRFPMATNWQPTLRSYDSLSLPLDRTDDDTARYFSCPSADDYKHSYGMNSLVGNSVVPGYDSKSNPVLAFDCSLPVANANGGIEAVDFRHRIKGRQGFANIIFVDGNAKTASRRKTDLPNVITIDQLQWRP